MKNWAFFKCKHPADRLGLWSHIPEVAPRDADFERVTFHLWCYRCSERVSVSASVMVGGLDAYIERGMKKA